MAVSIVNTIIVIISVVATVIYSGQSSLFTQKLNELLHWKYGCNPVSSVGNVTLHYFAKRGRAEAIRMLMVDQHIPFTEKNYTTQTWLEAKAHGTATGIFTFGQVPAITTTKGLQMVQSKVILQFLGRSVGLDCDCIDIVKCDIIAAGVDDLYQRRSKVLKDPNFSYSMRNEFINNILFTWLGYFDRLVPISTSESEGVYFASERLTWVDYLVFEMIDSNCDFVNHTKIEILKDEAITESYDNEEKKRHLNDCTYLVQNFPNLNIFYTNFRNRSGLKRYLLGGRHSYSIPFLPNVG